MSNIKIFVDEFGTKKYYLDENFHREDGPAVECIYGYKEWQFNGKRHRVDGPAIEWADGRKEWFLNGEKMTKEFWFEKLSDDLRIKLLFDEYFMKG